MPDIVLPDLPAGAEIVPEQILAVQAIMVAAELDALHAFDVVDTIGEQALRGALTVGPHAGGLLGTFVQTRGDRLSNAERRQIYARTIGLPGGEEGAQVNREFADLWLRFVASIDALVRCYEGGTPGCDPIAVDREARRAGRDLAANASLYGYAGGSFAARQLHAEVAQVLGLLGDQEILSAFGARSSWQLIERVNAQFLGHAVDVPAHRTRATSGAVILRWLEQRAQSYSDATSPFLDRAAITAAPSATPTVTPGPRDLVDACRQWLTTIG